MRKAIFALVFSALLALSPLAKAQQGFVTVSGSNLMDLNGTKANAQVCAQAVDLAGNPVSIRTGGAGGITTTNQVCTAASAGAWSMLLPNTTLAQPLNSCFNITATDSLTGADLIGPGYNCVQPTTDATSKWCSGGTCNFDKLPPMNRPTLASIVQGPAGTVDVVATKSAVPGTPASVVNKGTASAAKLEFTIPAGIAGPVGPSGGPKGDKGDKGDPGDITSASGRFVGNGAGIYGTQSMQTSEVHFFGDSLTARPVLTTSWPVHLVNDLGGVAVNRAVGGSFAADVANNQVFGQENPQDTGEPARLVMVGTNEMLYKGAGPYESVYRSVHQGILAWLATPASSKVFAAACNHDAGWVADDTYGIGTALRSATSGAQLTCALPTSGGALYVWYRVMDGGAGAFSYSVDGGASTALATATTPALGLANSNPSQAVAMVRIPVNSGSHYVQVQPVNSSGMVSILAVGTAPRAPLYTGPVVFSAGVPKPSNAQASAGQIAAATAYNTDSLADADLLRSDGLRILPVDIQRYYNPDGSDPGNGTAQMADVVHPTALGEQAILNAFEAAMQFSPRVASGRRRQTTVTTDYTVQPTDTDVIYRSADGYGSATLSLPYRNMPGIVQRMSVLNDNGGGGAIVRLVPAGGAALVGPGLSADGSLYLFSGESVDISFQDDGFRYRISGRQTSRDGVSVNGDSFALYPSARTYIALGGGRSTVTLSCTVGSAIPAPFPEGTYFIHALGALQIAAASGCTYQGPVSLPPGTGITVAKTGNGWFAM